jgi:Ca2+-binding RTX toxin-like protein
VQFADGTAWTPRDLQSIQTGVGVTVTGSGDLRGTASADTLTANGYGTSLQGGAGHDILNAQQRTGLVWNLTFNGGPGNDQITGSYAKDTYVFNRGDGWDTISDDLRFYPGTSAPAYFASNPNAPEYQDRVQFGSSIDASQLWFQRAGDDLQVSLVGATDGMTLTGWYTSMFREIEEFRLQDGRMLRNEDVNSLVQAMAAFSPPPAGQTHLPQDYQSELGGVIAANWR